MDNREREGETGGERERERELVILGPEILKVPADIGSSKEQAPAGSAF